MLKKEVHYTPNSVWHITHRCHKQEFILKLASHRQWIRESLADKNGNRETCWTGSIAVGSKTFVEETKKELGYPWQNQEIQE